jgi:hypothetical protein
MAAKDIKSIIKTKEYRTKGLGVREIARVMRKDPTQILRWLNYSVDKRVPKSKQVLTVK